MIRQRIITSLLLFPLSLVVGPATAQQPPAEEASVKVLKADIQRQVDQQLQRQAAERLGRLATFLEEQASEATKEVEPVRRAVGAGRSDRDLNRALSNVESAAKSDIVKKVYEDTLPETRRRISQPKVTSGGLIAAVDEKSKSYRDVADQLRQISSGVINDAPDRALSNLAQTYVPADVQKVLKQPNSIGRAATSNPVREGAAVTPLQLFAAGSGRVVGTEARATVDFPAVVAILQDESQDPSPRFAPWCSGTLISPNVVLSAAHCFCEYDASQKYNDGSTCKGGKFNLVNGKQVNALDPSFRRVFFQHAGYREIERVEIRDDYRFPIGDLSLVFLKQPVWDITPVKINAFNATPHGTNGIIVGFGRHSPLDQKGVPLATYAGADLGLKFYVRTVTAPCTPGYENKQLVCWNYSNALPQSLRGNTCNGDSGGPLFAKINNEDVLIGVTSGGTEQDCGLGDFSFDVEVFAYRGWINEGVQSDRAIQAAPITSPLNPLNHNPGRYHLAKESWQFHPLSQFYNWPLHLPDNVRLVRISVNTNRILQSPLRLRLVDDRGEPILDPQGRPLCDMETEDSATACEVPNSASRSWRVQASGPGARWFQVVATGF